LDYIFYIDKQSGGVPFMDVLNANTLEEASRYARGLLAQRPDALAARVFVGDVLHDTILPSI